MTFELHPTLSLVILCYRAEKHVEKFVSRVISELEDACIDDYELILVANFLAGMADQTPAVAKELASKNPRIKFSAVTKEGWMGWDMRTGFAIAEGELIGVIDGDGQMPASDVPILYNLIRSGEYDLVKTYRLTRGDGVTRKALSHTFNQLFGLLFPGVSVRDVNSKPKIMTRGAYEKLALQSNDWFIDAEIMIQAGRHQLRIGEVSTDFLGLVGRRSFVDGRTVLEFIKNLLLYRIREWLV